MIRLLTKHAVAALVCGVLRFTALDAQQSPPARDTVLEPRLLPVEVEREVTDAFNGPNTVRATGAYEVDSGSVVSGDMAVLNGPLSAKSLRMRFWSATSSCTFASGVSVPVFEM